MAGNLPTFSGLGPTLGAAYEWTPDFLTHYLGLRKNSKDYNYLLKQGALQYYEAGTWLPVVSRANFFTAIQNMKKNTPTAYAKMLGFLGLPPNSTVKNYTKYEDAVWQGLENSLGQFAGYQSLGVATAGRTAAQGYAAQQRAIKQQLDLQAQIANQQLAQQSAQFNQQMAAQQAQATQAQQSNAMDYISQYLQMWGLDSEAPQLWSIITKNGHFLVNHDALLAVVRGNAPSGLGPKMDETMRTNYDNAFPGLRQQQAESRKYGWKPLTESTYASVTQGYLDTADKYGLGRGFFGKAEMGKLISGNVSVGEFDSRIQNGYLAAKNADATTKRILLNQYGIGHGDLLAYFLDPKRGQAQMEQKVAQATLQGYAQDTGVPNFNAGQARNLLNATKSGTLEATGLGDPFSVYNVASAKKGLDAAAAGQSLIDNAPGAGGPHIDTNTLIGSVVAGFGGTKQTAAQSAVTTAKEEAIAPFESGGGVAMSNRGTDIGYGK
jgi:hypothetical protein